MPLFEVGIADVKKFDKGLLCKLCGMVGLVKALGIKFDKFCEGFEKPKEVDIPKTLTELKSPVPAAAPSPAGYETPNSGRGMRIKIESARIKGYLPKSSLQPQVDDGQGLAESAIVIADDEAKFNILKQKVDSQRRKIEHLESDLQEERVELVSALEGGHCEGAAREPQHSKVKVEEAAGKNNNRAEGAPSRATRSVADADHAGTGAESRLALQNHNTVTQGVCACRGGRSEKGNRDCTSSGGRDRRRSGHGPPSWKSAAKASSVCSDPPRGALQA